MSQYIGEAVGCKPTPAYDASQREADRAYWQPYVDIVSAETPGFDHEERREPKELVDPAVNIRRRPYDCGHYANRNLVLAA